MTDYHEGVAEHALRLEPRSAATAAVRLVEPLRDDPLELLLTGDAEQLSTIAGVILAEQDPRSRRDDAGEREPANIERLGPERLPVEKRRSKA